MTPGLVLHILIRMLSEQSGDFGKVNVAGAVYSVVTSARRARQLRACQNDFKGCEFRYALAVTSYFNTSIFKSGPPPSKSGKSIFVLLVPVRKTTISQVHNHTT